MTGVFGLLKPPPLPSPTFCADVVASHQFVEAQSKLVAVRANFSVLLMEPRFYLLCFMAFGLNLSRSTFTDWMNVYLSEVTHVSPSEAALGRFVRPLLCSGSEILAQFNARLLILCPTAFCSHSVEE